MRQEIGKLGFLKDINYNVEAEQRFDSKEQIEVGERG